jgi:hypothetical protein
MLGIPHLLVKFSKNKKFKSRKEEFLEISREF